MSANDPKRTFASRIPGYSEFYRLLRANPAYASALQRLRAASDGKPLRVRFLAPNSDVIESVEAMNS